MGHLVCYVKGIDLANSSKAQYVGLRFHSTDVDLHLL